MRGGRERGVKKMSGEGGGGYELLVGNDVEMVTVFL